MSKSNGSTSLNIGTERSRSAGIEVTRLYRVEGDGRLKAFVDIALAGFVIKGLRVVQGEKGLFVGMPSQQGKDGRWFNNVYPLNKEYQQQLSEIVLAAYNG